VTGLGEGQYPWDHRVAAAIPAGMGSMTNGSITAAHGAPMMAGSMTNGSITAAHGAPMMGGSMTNGTVMAGGGAHELNVSYHGAEIENGKCEGRAVPGKPGCVGTAVVDVPATAPIVAVVPGSRADVKPGLRIVAFVADDAAGHPALSRATVEKNGVKPVF
jgi:hypothetical protein